MHNFYCSVCTAVSRLLGRWLNSCQLRCRLGKRSQTHRVADACCMHKGTPYSLPLGAASAAGRSCTSLRMHTPVPLMVVTWHKYATFVAKSVPTDCWHTQDRHRFNVHLRWVALRPAATHCSHDCLSYIWGSTDAALPQFARRNPMQLGLGYLLCTRAMLRTKRRQCLRRMVYLRKTTFGGDQSVASGLCTSENSSDLLCEASQLCACCHCIGH